MIKVNKNLTNCTGDIPEHYEKGATVDITLKANTGAKFVKDTDARLIHNDMFGSDKSENMNISSDRTTATIHYTIPSYVDDITIYGNCSVVAPVEEDLIEVTKNLTNCTGDIPEHYEKGATVDITLKANTGTKFAKDTDARLIHNDMFGSGKSVNMNISSDRTTATIHYKIPSYVDYITVYGDCSVVEPVGEDYGSINVYVVTLENLKAFANARFIRATEQEIVYNDLGKYVNRIKRIYTNVEKGKTDVIRCANYNTNISVFQPVKSKITLDFGNVVVPSHNNDNTDFESTVKLFIPFVGFVDVPNDYTGETLNLQIDINVVTGNGLYRLIYDGTLIQTGDCTPSQDVLYKTADMELTKIGGEEWNEQRYMGLEPYLFVKWYESKNPNGRNNDFKQGVISSFTGFNSFTDITPISTQNMLANEQQMIYNILQTGVYIE